MPFYGDPGAWYEESEHPRGSGGRWTSKGGGNIAYRRATPLEQAPVIVNWRDRGAPASSLLGRRYSREARLIGGVVFTGNPRDAARALYEGYEVELRQPREVATLLDHLAQVGKTMIRMGRKAPTFNLCNVLVSGTSLFCLEGHDIPRVKMPQLPEGEAGENLFKDWLIKRGYKVTSDKEDSSYLRPTQNELNGVKVAQMAQAFAAGKRQPYRLFVSRDNYIIDGHHRWAADIGLAAYHGKFKGEVTVGVERVDAGIIEMLNLANKFTNKAGRVAVSEMKGQRDVLRGQTVQERELTARGVAGAELRSWQKYVDDLRARAQTIGKREGFKGTFSVKPVKGYEGRQLYDTSTMGEYNRDTGKITLFAQPLSYQKRPVQNGIMAHEVQHDKFFLVTNAYDKGDKAVKKALDPFLSPTGKLQQLYRTGSKVSEYVKDFWWKVPDQADIEDSGITQAVGRRQVARMERTAIDETLAEVACLREQGKGKRIPPIWNELYDTINNLSRRFSR